MMTVSYSHRSLCFVAVLSTVVLVTSHDCIHDKLLHESTKPVVTGFQNYGDDHPGMASGEDTYNLLSDQDRQMLRKRKLKKLSRKLGSGNFKPIRIHVRYDLLTGATSAKQDFLKQKLMPKAVEWLSEALSVRPVVGNFIAPRFCTSTFSASASGSDPNAYLGRVCAGISTNERCGGSDANENPQIPSSWFATMKTCSNCCPSSSCTTHTGGAGLADTDYALFVTSLETSNCAGATAAYASSCARDQYDRPTMGYANFCPSSLDTSDDKFAEQLSTAIHEVLHALGFSASSHALFRSHTDQSPLTARDANGNVASSQVTCVDGSSQTKSVPSTNTLVFEQKRGARQAKIVTPTVRTVVREHFNCSSMNGAELENQPTTSGGCWGSHWEERLFNNEVMGPIGSAHNEYGRVTLAYMEDTGWYKANFSKATHAYWGYKAGCPFTEDKCIDPTDQSVVAGGSNTFCAVKNQEGCTRARDALGKCNLADYNGNLPSEYQYFTDGKSGGSMQQADYCPFIVGYSNRRCATSRTFSSSDRNYKGEVYGTGSKCIDTSAVQTVDNFGLSGTEVAGCHTIICSTDSFAVRFASQSSSSGPTTNVDITCTKADGEAGTEKTIGGTFGSKKMTCPPYADVCVVASDTAAPTSSGNNSNTGGGGNAGASPSPSPSPNPISGNNGTNGQGNDGGSGSMVAPSLSVAIGAVALLSVALA